MRSRTLPSFELKDALNRVNDLMIRGKKRRTRNQCRDDNCRCTGTHRDRDFRKPSPCLRKRASKNDRRLASLHSHRIFARISASRRHYCGGCGTARFSLVLGRNIRTDGMGVVLYSFICREHGNTWFVDLTVSWHDGDLESVENQAFVLFAERVRCCARMMRKARLV